MAAIQPQEKPSTKIRPFEYKNTTFGGCTGPSSESTLLRIACARGLFPPHGQGKERDQEVGRPREMIHVKAYLDQGNNYSKRSGGALERALLRKEEEDASAYCLPRQPESFISPVLGSNLLPPAGTGCRSMPDLRAIWSSEYRSSLAGRWRSSGLAHRRHPSAGQL